MDNTPVVTGVESPVAKSAIRKVSLRLVPFVALMFFINYLDRTAIGFAALMILLARSNRAAVTAAGLAAADEQIAKETRS